MMKMTIQIKTFLYFPPVKTSEAGLRQKVIDFFDEINAFLLTHKVDSSDIIVSDSTDYIFVHVVYTVKKKK